MNLYLYRSPSSPSFPALFERNACLAGWIAEQLGRVYQGEYKPGAELDAAFWVPHAPMTPEEAGALGITSKEQIFGAVVEPLHAQKSVFHCPLPRATYVPAHFPLDFSRSVQVISAPGYTAFTPQDALLAFESLLQQGHSPRFKNPTATAGLGQRVASNRQEAEAVIAAISGDVFRRFGVVIEANIPISVGQPHAFSSGWIELGGEEYTYVGTQSQGEKNIYTGTRLHMVRGHEPPYVPDIPNAVTDHTTYLLGLLGLLDGLQIATRCNFNFVKSMHDEVFAVEPTFRIGGATGAELLAIGYLKDHPEEDQVVASTRFVYDQHEPLPAGAHRLYSGNDRIFGVREIFASLETESKIDQCARVLNKRQAKDSAVWASHVGS